MAARGGERRRWRGGIITGRPRLCLVVLLAALVQHLALGARPPRRFWGACVRGGQQDTSLPPSPPPPSNTSGVAAAGAPVAPGLLVAEPEQQEQQHAAGAIEPVVLTKEEQGVLALVAGAETPERVLGLVAKLPAVRACPDFHLRIANAGRGDASVAAAALRRLGKLVGEATAGKNEGERAAIRARVAGDRRFEQLLECVACQVDALGPAEASNALFALAALRVEKEEGEELLGAILRAAANALANDLWVGLQPSETVTLAVSLAHVVAFLPPVPPAQLLPLLEALEGRLARDAPLLSSHDLSRLAGALAAMGRGSSGSTQQAGRRQPKGGGLNHGPLLRLMGEIVRRHPQSFAPRDLAAVADALAQLGHGNATVRAGVAAACAGRIAELPPDDLATLARALGAWAGDGDGEEQYSQQQKEAEEVLMLELLVCAEARRGDLAPAHTADLLWSFGRHGFRNATAFMLRELPGLFARADGRLAPGSPEAFSASDLAKVVWAYATLLPHPTGRARVPAAAFTAAEAGNATEAPAAAGEEEAVTAQPQPQHQSQPEPVVEQPQQHLLSALAGRAAVLVRHTLAADPMGAVEPPLLVALAWALVTLGHRDAGFLEAVGEALAPQLDALSLPEIARLAWALTEGTAGGGGPRTAFFDALALLVELHHPHFRLKDLALSLFALASRGYDGAGLRLFSRHHYQQQQQQQRRRLGGEGAASLAASFLREEELRALHPSDEARLLWALARLRGEDEQGDEAAADVGDAVIDGVCHDLRTKLATLSPQDLALTLDALAAPAGSSSEARAKLQAHLARQLPPWLEAFSSPELAAVLHSLLGLRQPPAEAGLAEAAHALVERRLRRLLDRAERAEAAGAGAADEARLEDGDEFYHLSRCQQLLGLWRRTGAGAAE